VGKGWKERNPKQREGGTKGTDENYSIYQINITVWNLCVLNKPHLVPALLIYTHKSSTCWQTKLQGEYLKLWAMN